MNKRQAKKGKHNYKVEKGMTSVIKWCDKIPKAELKDKMLKYGFTAPDMTVTEFVEDFETL